MRCYLLSWIITIAAMKGSKYYRLPSGLIPIDHFSPILRDAYNLPQNVPQSFASDFGGTLMTPPRMKTSFIPTTDDSGYGNVGGSLPSYTITPKGITYAEFRQMMQNKIVENPNETPYHGNVNGPTPTKPRPPSVTPPVAIAEVTTVPAVMAPTTPTSMVTRPADRAQYIMDLHNHYRLKPEYQKTAIRGQTYTTFGGSQFYQSLFGLKNGFSPLSFLLNGRGGQSPLFVPVPIVVPPPPPPPPGPKCYTNPSGFLCCNVTLENTMEMAYKSAKSEGISLCNVQKMAAAVQAETEKKFKTSFETIAAHKDFVAKVNFAGDLNCKIEVDGKFLLAYATPLKEQEVNIIDANTFFSGDADDLFDTLNGTESKPTYIVYGPIR